MKKTNRLKKWGKGLLIFSAVTFSGLLVWANWNEPTITEKLARIEMSSFDLSNVADHESYDKIGIALKKEEGVTACAVNPDSKMASVTFYPDKISKDELLKNIMQTAGTSVSFKQFKMKAGCPVRATSEFFGKLKQSLCFRN